MTMVLKPPRTPRSRNVPTKKLLKKRSTVTTVPHKKADVIPKEICFLDDDLLRADDEKEEPTIEKSDNSTQTKPIVKVEKPPIMCVNKKISSHFVRNSVIVPTIPPKKIKVKLMDWKKYHRLNIIYGYMDDLERDFPAICTVTVIGKSVEGRDIKMLKISNSNATNEAVWLDASIHSREWISTAAVTYIAEIIVKNFQKLSSSLTNKDWYIVPVLNPDGYEYTHTHDRMWRKNRARYGGECVGVDLNRNFGHSWGIEEGSSDDPTNVFYRGPEPFSEPESVAVRDTILGSPTPFKVFLSFHSFFELIIFPWGFQKEPCPDYLNLLEGGLIMSRAIYESSGLIYKVGSSIDLTYNASGTSIDWSYAIAKIPYCYMVELRSKRYKFRLPREQILDTCVESWNAVVSLMDFVDKQDYKL